MRLAGERAAADPDFLVGAVLSYAGWTPADPLVFDAVRHHDMLEALREAVEPTPVLHVALTLSDRERRRRLTARGDLVDVLLGDRHSTEEQVSDLIDSAHLRLDGPHPVKLLLAEITAALDS